VEKLFQQTIQSTGLNATMLEIADIREQCAYVHIGELEQAQEKAAGLIEMGAERLANLSQAHYSTNRIVKSAVIVGSSLAGLTAALELARSGILVTLVESSEHLDSTPAWSDGRIKQLANQSVAAISDNPRIIPLLGARINEVIGEPGDYQVEISQNGKITRVSAGAILVAGEAHPRSLGAQHWVDRRRVKTQVEFEQELNLGQAPQNIVMIFCAEQEGREHCSRLCCTAGIRQALRARQLNPLSNVIVLFRDLYLGGPESDGEKLLKQARQAGVTFFRYPKGHPPVIRENGIDLFDPLTNETLQIPSDRVVLAMPLLPPENSKQLAALLRLPQDEQGFLFEPRVRLRPDRYTDDGIFVMGGSHQPADLNETLLQAYLISARVRSFLSQDTIQSQAPTAQVNPKLCTGCAECLQACRTNAIRMDKRSTTNFFTEVLSLSKIDPLRCTGCGSCAVACPVKAITIPGWEDVAILAQISAALRPSTKIGSLQDTGDYGEVIQPSPRLLVLACEWSAYAAADIAGARQQAYPAGVRIIRMNCSARFDPFHVLWAFLNGADGVLLGVCPVGECHYGQGNLQAQERYLALKQQLAEHGIDPKRLRLELLSAYDGDGFIRAIESFMNSLLFF
jgi:heterodisulfide reductase subunit A2